MSSWTFLILFSLAVIFYGIYADHVFTQKSADVFSKIRDCSSKGDTKTCSDADHTAP